DRWSVSLMYGNYAAQPELGYLTRREGILTSGSLRVSADWVATGSIRWDLASNNINQYVIGTGYVDDCFVLGVNYVRSYNYGVGGAPPVLNDTYLLQLGLRTIGSYSIPIP
ncbi:LPS-assembly protein LptD, partial [Bradyrhizobium tropiciagri]|nr:LPS-assembly protein LptD [Bradyrhizobium tropiciagri]